MESLLLQDLITLRGTATTQIVQSASSYLDLGDLEDVVIYTELREITGSPAITFETSCVALDAAFVTLLALPTPLTVGARTDMVLASMAKVPPMRFVRWRLSGSTNPWDVTMRIWVAAHGWA